LRYLIAVPECWQAWATQTTAGTEPAPSLLLLLLLRELRRGLKDSSTKRFSIPETGFEAGLVRVRVLARARAQRQQQGQVELAR
jgi:hypothetical protein